jgi:hypothetical protein
MAISVPEGKAILHALPSSPINRRFSTYFPAAHPLMLPGGKTH